MCASTCGRAGSEISRSARFQRRSRTASWRKWEAMPDEDAIVAKDLTRTFGRFVAVDHITFDVHAGEVFGFLGAHGAGKTTAIRMLTGLLAPSAGAARVAGHDISRDSEAVKRSIG